MNIIEKNEHAVKAVLLPFIGAGASFKRGLTAECDGSLAGNINDTGDEAALLITAGPTKVLVGLGGGLYALVAGEGNGFVHANRALELSGGMPALNDLLAASDSFAKAFACTGLGIAAGVAVCVGTGAVVAGVFRTASGIICTKDGFAHGVKLAVRHIKDSTRLPERRLAQRYSARVARLTSQHG